MAFCDNCGNFNKTYADSIGLTKQQIKNTPFIPYEPNLNYFNVIETDSFECLCGICLNLNKSEGKKYKVTQLCGGGD